MQKVDLTKGKVASVIMLLALPIMGSSLLQFTYNIIDMMWVGKMGSNAVASIGTSSLYVNIGNALNSLVVIGCGIKVAHAIGEKNDKEVSEYINVGIVINTIIGVIFGLILILCGRYFIDFLHVNNATVEKDAYLYLIINAPILFFSFFNMLYTRILGSFGNNKLAFKINLIGVSLNIILDPIFIYILRYGVVGAAISTLISNVTMFILFKSFSTGTLKYNKKIKLDVNKIVDVIKLGLPMAIQRVLFTIINILLARIIAIFGSDAIAAQKVGAQIEAVAYMVIGGLNGAVASFTGQNFGAKEYKRIREGYRCSLSIGIAYALFTAVIFWIFDRELISIFIKDEETIIMAAGYLHAVAFSQAFSAIEMISNGLFTGIGKPNISATISIVFTTLRIPLALVLTRFFGVNGVWMSIAISSVIKGIFAYLLYIVQLRKKYI
ncbi:MATE family efflux transporter [Clostridium sp. MSJ-8]|uniref:MATE family efflux transporter n=1 Tax=Clostridium sp. MSJ-8 TaxID=2841510 RepID=UPI001C0F2752|nr:MATE family efflux transporter [Clostridium sp. MSJ-8]MBU5486914.1 MATE family efflux transporter [Clostridium sp. MSJ-8]